MAVEKANYPVALMCRVLEVSRSGYYASKAKARPTLREAADAELVESALVNALSWRAPGATLIHHSDRGSQYASDSYQQLMERHGITSSMSRKGDCWDNAAMESFFGTLKQEWAQHQWWRGLLDARASVHDYIEVFYNRQRLHSSLGYRTPEEVDHARA